MTEADARERALRGVEAQSFRDALARWASGVAVVAVREGEALAAMTVSSFCSASLDPPLVALSLSHGARTLERLRETPRFAISVLAESQQAIAARCAEASGAPDTFDEDAMVEGALVGLLCSVEALHACGDHVLVVGLVEQVRRGTGHSPLLYWDRRYRAVQAVDDA